MDHETAQSSARAENTEKESGMRKAMVAVGITLAAITVLGLVTWKVSSWKKGSPSPTTTIAGRAPQGVPLGGCNVPAQIYTIRAGDELRPPRSNCSFGGSAFPRSDISKVDFKLSDDGKHLIYARPKPGIAEVRIEMIFCDEGMIDESRALTCKTDPTPATPQTTRQAGAGVTQPQPLAKSGQNRTPPPTGCHKWYGNTDTGRWVPC